MQDKELIKTIKKYCETFAGEVASEEEDFNPRDWSGGNFDDAWNGGVLDGQTQACNDILVFIKACERTNEL